MTKDLLAMVKPLKKVVNEDFYVLTNDEYQPSLVLTVIITAN